MEKEGSEKAGQEDFRKDGSVKKKKGRERVGWSRGKCQSRRRRRGEMQTD